MILDRFRLDDKVAVITGGGRGLGAAIAVVLYLLGGARPQTPDIDRFLAGDDPAWHSPPLLARVRRRALQPAPELSRP